MNRETIFDNPTATVWYYPDLNIIHHKINAFIYGDDFRSVLTAGADYFEAKNCTKWLSDDRGNSALRKEDTDWAVEVWNPRVLQAGWKKWALLLPDRATGRMQMKKLIEDYKGLGVTVEIFDNETEAINWLAVD